MDAHLQLEPEEKELLDSYERDEWQSVHALHEQLRLYQEYSVAALEAKGLVSVFLPPEDIQALRQKATEMGMPYPLLIAHIVHQYLAGKLGENQ
jgi:predicted DNA binding CopG/RHH family protein